MSKTSAAPVSLDDQRLINDGEAAAVAYAKSGRENILAMARGLEAARRTYPSKQAFGRWFDSSPYREAVTNPTMRAALIYIGKHEDAAVPIVANSNTADPEAIAAKIKASVAPSSENLKTAPSPIAKYVADLKKTRAKTVGIIDSVGEATAELMSDLISKLDRVIKELEVAS